MSTDLREELEALARTQTFTPDASTWDRGRRARRRGRAAAIAAVLVLVISVGGLLATGPGSPRTGPAGGNGSTGVPSFLEPVPQHLQQRDGSDRWTGPVEGDLATGTGAVAFVTDLGLPVLVTADGDYHLLDLPGFVPPDRWAPPFFDDLDPSQTRLWLSPDGRRLAWAWLDPDAGSVSPPSGVRVADLATGEVTETVLEVEDSVDGSTNSVAVTQLAWSPDSRWLAWRGPSVRSWTSFGSDGLATGVVGPGGIAEPRPGARRATTLGLAVDDRGNLTTGPGLADGAIGPDGSTAFGSTNAAVTVLAPGEGQRSVALPEDAFPDGASVRVVGWLDREHVVVVVTRRADPGTADLAQPTVGVLSIVPGAPDYRTVTRSGPADGDGSVIAQPSLAVDLMTEERPTVAPVDPDWPWSAERRRWVTAGAALGAGALLLSVGALVRRRSGRIDRRGATRGGQVPRRTS